MAPLLALALTLGCGSIKRQTDDAGGSKADGGPAEDSEGVPKDAEGVLEGGTGEVGGTMATRADLLAQLTMAEERWSAAAPTCSTYRYDRRFESSFGFWRNTIVRVDESGVASREHTWGGGNQPAGTWTEDRTQIGTHPVGGNWGEDVGFSPSTVEQLLAECRNVLQHALEGSTFTLKTNARGVPISCITVPAGCFDDCAAGIWIPYFTCDEPWDPVDLGGSYDVTLAGGDLPSTTFRLHLGRSNEGIDGYRGMADNPYVPCLVTVEADAIGIQRCEREQGDIRLMRRPDGSLDGTAVGSWMNRVGTVTKHVAPPALDVVQPTPQQPPVLLPWRPISLTLSDAVDFAQLRQLLTTRTDRAAAVSVLLGEAPSANLLNRWVGSQSAIATFAWNDISNSTLTFDVAAGLRGFSGATAPALSVSVSIPAVGTAVLEHEFSGSTVEVATWGAASLATADPGCDTGSGCLKLGAPVIPCKGPGLAGLLAAPPGATAIEVRLRLVGPGPAGSSPAWVNFTIIPEGGEPTSAPALVTLPPELIDLGAGAGEARLAGEWMVAQLPLPNVPTPSRWAFELQLSTACSPLVTSLPDRVLIDSIRIR